MSTRDSYIQEVTEFLARPKTLAGIDLPIPWQPNRNPSELCIKVPIEVDGLISNQRLVVNFFPSDQGLRFTILVIFNFAVCRLDFEENGGHTNGFANSERLPKIVQGPHFHRWELNTRFVLSDARLPKLDNAEALPANIRTFDAALRWFCGEANIALPNTHQIQLPPRNLI